MTETTTGKDYFASAVKAEHEYGVLYQGEWETPFDGTAVAVRRHARALAEAGLPVVLKSFSNVVVNEHGVAEPVPMIGIPEEVEKEIQGIHLTSVGSVMPMVKHAVVHSARHLNKMIMRGISGPADTVEMRLAAQQDAYAATILYSVWERNHVAAELASHLATVGECWVPCEQNRQLLEQAGVQRVRVIPHPYSYRDDICKVSRRRPHARYAKRFYAIGAWQPRKAFHELLGAFLCAYGPDQGAQLVIKYSGGVWPDYPSPAQSWEHWMKHPDVLSNGWNEQNVRRFVSLLSGRVPRSRIIQLHFVNNIYVCASHGEAWCLPAFEAKLSGNTLVHVPFGGTADFCTEGDVSVPYELGPVPSSYNWEPDAKWAQYRQSDLVAALKQAEVPERFQFPEGFDQRFSSRVVGHKMRAAILEMTDRLHPPASAYYRKQLHGVSSSERAV